MDDIRSTTAPAPATRRKAEHIDLCRSDTVEVPALASWQDVRLLHRALPEVDRDDICLDVAFLGHALAAPLVISSMTGGVDDAITINRRLAAVAQRHGLAMGLGSGRVMLETPALARTFAVAREAAPTAFLFANIGAAQLVPQRSRPAVTVDQVLRLVEVIDAQALAVHLNFLQEAVQPEGDTAAAGVLAAVGRLVSLSPVPIIVKEIGCGIGPEVAQALADVGVAAIDVGGQGGTSWALVESARAAAQGDATRAQVGRTFADWGIPTPVAVPLAVRAGRPVIASGGVRTGLDAARALALGATAVGVARPLLQAALDGAQAADDWVAGFLAELGTALFLCGARDVAALRHVRRVVVGETAAWLAQLMPGPD